VRDPPITTNEPPGTVERNLAATQQRRELDENALAKDPL